MTTASYRVVTAQTAICCGWLTFMLVPTAAAQVVAPGSGAAAAAVAEAVAEGRDHPRWPEPRMTRKNFAADQGTAERRCVEVADAPVRSGEFVLHPGTYPLARYADSPLGRFKLVPLVHVRGAPLSFRARSLDDPAVVMQYDNRLTLYRLGPPYAEVSESERELFFPVLLKSADTGKWLVVAEHAQNWGCFIVEIG